MPAISPAEPRGSSDQGQCMDHMAYHVQIRQLFVEAVSGRDNRLDLGRASLLIAGEEYPGLDILRYVAKLEAMAAAVRPGVTTTDDPIAKIEYLNGYVCAEGKRLGVPTPVNDVVVKTVLSFKVGALKPDPKNLEPIAAVLPR